ncbi:MAG: Mov34/MPN/PAD-1 family protein [Luteibaculum sp.]
MSAIVFREESLDKLTRHLESSYPNEGVGFMYGLDGEEREIIDVLPVLNSKEGDQRRRFEVSPKDYLEAERYADQLGLQLLGVYHSHPNHPAIPSEHDLKSAVPFFSYVIQSVQNGKAVYLTSWKLNDAHQFEEEELAGELIKNASV